MQSEIDTLRQQIATLQTELALKEQIQKMRSELVNKNIPINTLDMARTRIPATVEDYLAEIQDEIQRILAQFQPTSRFRTPTERIVNGISGSLDRVRELHRNLRQNYDNSHARAKRDNDTRHNINRIFLFNGNRP